MKLFTATLIVLVASYSAIADDAIMSAIPETAKSTAVIRKASDKQKGFGYINSNEFVRGELQIFAVWWCPYSGRDRSHLFAYYFDTKQGKWVRFLGTYVDGSEDLSVEMPPREGAIVFRSAAEKNLLKYSVETLPPKKIEDKKEEQAKIKSLVEKKWGFPEDGKKRYGIHWDGKSLVRKVQRIASPLLTKHLPKATVDRVCVYNPFSAKTGRELFPYSLILQDGKPVYIENDKDAANFLSSLKLKVENEQSAKEVALLFGLLRDFELSEKQRKHKGNWVKSEPEDWELTVEKNGEVWSITCPFMWDPVISACAQWKLTIGNNGVVSAKVVKQLFRVGGYH